MCSQQIGGTMNRLVEAACLIVAACCVRCGLCCGDHELLGYAGPLLVAVVANRLPWRQLRRGLTASVGAHPAEASA